MVPVLDRVLDAPYPLTTQDITAYRAQGFVRLRGVFPADALAPYVEAVAAEVTARNPLAGKAMAERSTYEKAFTQVFNLWRRNETVRALVFSKRLAGIAARLVGAAGVRLYHDQALFKEAGGGPTPWHCDQVYWPLASDKAVTVWIPLQDTPAEMGPLGFAPGSQALADSGRNLTIGDESEAVLAHMLGARGYAFDGGPFALGDVSFHGGWTFHRADGNGSTEPRRAMTAIYMDADMRLVEPATEAQSFDRDMWCRGVEVGAVIDTPRNPVLYP